MADTSYLSWPFFEAHHRQLAQRLRAAGDTIADDAKGSDEYTIASKLVRKLAEHGLLSAAVPTLENTAAAGLDVRSICLSREHLAYHSAMADFVFAMQGLGSGPISLFGTPAQQQEYLPRVANGASIAAFAISEAEAGSDVASIACSAEKRGGDYILNGSKHWISNAGIAGFYVVFARTGEAAGAKGLSAFIVDAHSKGLATERIDILSPHPLGRLVFENCKVPARNLLGNPGEGFKIAMATLDVFRSSVGAAALGFARRALDEACQHAKARKLFGQNLADFQITRERIADMALEVDASALLVYRAAWVKDSGAERVTKEAAMAKLYATEHAQLIIDRAMQMLGGAGLVAESVLERLYRDIRPLRIYEGASEVQKLIIAGQILGK